MDDVTIRRFLPSDADWIAQAHGHLYRQNDGFDDTFQPLVERILQEFVAGHNPQCERGWVAEQSGHPIGCIFCVKLSEDIAKLRLFLLLPEARGQGLGLRLLQTCMGFAKECGYRKMQLWTHESHRAACALYQRNGWRLVSSKPVHSFGCDLVEQSWETVL